VVVVELDLLQVCSQRQVWRNDAMQVVVRQHKLTQPPFAEIAWQCNLAVHIIAIAAIINRI
jgi:hypothetical protein